MTATDRAVELVTIAATAAADKLATDIIAYDVSEQLVITDAFLLCSASNDRQVRAIVDEIEQRLRQAGAKPVRREGEREGRWVLLDYLDVVIHVQHAEERVFYALERLWKDCPQIPLPEPAGRPRPGGAAARGVELSAGAGQGAVPGPDAGGGEESGPPRPADETVKLVLWRHGQTTWNVERRFQGQSDIPLDEVGVAQAGRAARLLAALRPVRSFSSDLSRASRTAASWRG